MPASPDDAAAADAAVLPVPVEQLDQLVRGEHGHPHALLGPHPHDGGVTVRRSEEHTSELQSH